jgi:hypothetical protein
VTAEEPMKDEPSSSLGWVTWRDDEPATSEPAPADHGYDFNR